MPSKTTAPNPAALDGPVVIAHSPEVAQAYRDAAAESRRRQVSGLPPASAQAVQDTPPSAGQVDARLAAQARDKRIHALKADLMRYEKEAQRSPIGTNGMVIPHLVDRQRAVQGVIEGVQIEIKELAALDGEELIQWAVNSGGIRWTQSGSALL